MTKSRRRKHLKSRRRAKPKEPHGIFLDNRGHVVIPDLSKQMARVEVLLNPEIQALCKKAAELKGLTLEGFLIASIEGEARKTIEQHQTLQLNRTYATAQPVRASIERFAPITFQSSICTNSVNQEDSVEQHQTLKLNQEDSEALVNALLNPPQPNEALKSAALYYQQVMGY